MNQGDVYLVDLNPIKGSEQSGIRPAVIVSGNALNDNMPVCIVCPVTKVIKGYAGCVIISPSESNGLTEISEIISFQIRVLSQERLIKKLGYITKKELKALLSGINDILTY